MKICHQDTTHQFQPCLRLSMEMLTLTPHLQPSSMSNEAWIMFSREKETKGHSQRKENVQCLWPEMEKGLQRFHY